MLVPIHAQEIRGQVANDGFTWTADNFAGFYYNFDDDIKTEELTTVVSVGAELGVTYTTTAMADDFEFWDWGQYNVIGFMGEKYFSGYLDTPDSADDVLFEKSDDENVLSNEQLLKILYDDDAELTVTSGVPVTLEEGYELGVKADPTGMLVELSKNDEIVDSDVLLPPTTTSTMADTTYVYRRDIGDSKDVVIIAAHFDKVVSIDNQPVAICDGLWQLSDTAVDVGTQYDKMTVQTVDATTITMNNEYNDITLSKNKEISLMPGISIRTADSDDLRYYIYRDVTCECG